MVGLAVCEPAEAVWLVAGDLPGDARVQPGELAVENRAEEGWDTLRSELRARAGGPADEVPQEPHK